MKKIIALSAVLMLLLVGCSKEYKYVKLKKNSLGIVAEKYEIIKAKDNKSAYQEAYIDFCSTVKSKVDVYGDSDVVGFLLTDDNGNDVGETVDRNDRETIEYACNLVMQNDSVAILIVNRFKEARQY